MIYKGEDGITRRLRPLGKMPTVNDKTREYWRKRTLHWHKTKLFYPVEIKTGVCYFCKREGRAQGSKTTALHHLKYNNDDPLEWTLEVCIKCHAKVDPRNKRQIQRTYAVRDFARTVDREEERIAMNKMKTSSYKRYF